MTATAVSFALAGKKRVAKQVGKCGCIALSFRPFVLRLNGCASACGNAVKNSPADASHAAHAVVPAHVTRRVFEAVRVHRHHDVDARRVEQRLDGAVGVVVVEQVVDQVDQHLAARHLRRSEDDMAMNKKFWGEVRFCVQDASLSSD